MVGWHPSPEVSVKKKKMDKRATLKRVDLSQMNEKRHYLVMCEITKQTRRPAMLMDNGVCITRVEKRFVVLLVVEMILPQVHLRKPCYDFSFL
jgi:hypothetical protein